MTPPRRSSRTLARPRLLQLLEEAYQYRLTLLQAGASFAVAQVVSVAAQRAIMEMRERVQERVTRLPIRFFDDTQSGVLISRIMTDAEGIRNLIGTGIIQLVGGALTAGLAVAVLFWLNWQLTIAILGFLPQGEDDLKSLVKKPPGVGRYKANDIGIFDDQDVEAVKKLGFEVELP